jgi:metal-responsive CopG/Arc/MetJ family transcriptional regulator
MATINFSVPEEVKQAFNEAFEGQNKSAVLTQMMREAVARAEEQRRREVAARRILARRARAPQRGAQTLAKARASGRP